MKLLHYMNKNPWAKIVTFILWAAVLIFSASLVEGLYSWGVFLIWIAATILIGALTKSPRSNTKNEMRNLKMNSLVKYRVNRFVFLIIALAFPFITTDELSNLPLWVYLIWGGLAWVASGLFNENGFT